MSRVLMVSKAFVVGIYQRKAELIAQQGIDLRVIVPPSWKDERGDTPLERAYTSGYQLDVLPIRFNGNFHLHFYDGLNRAIQEFKPQIVHIDEEPYNLASWQALSYAKRIQAKTVFFSWQNIKRDYPFPFSWGERWALKQADALIVGTDSAGEVWRQKGYKGSLYTLPQFGTDTALFSPPEDVLPRREAFTIGYIGRLVEEKGVHLLLQAVAKLQGHWHLKILGGGPMRDDLIQQATQLGIRDNVEFLAQIPSTEIPAFYHTLDVMVLPSLTWPNWKEQFGRVLVEAMASGVPVIGSDSGAIPSVIGDAGIIVPEGDINALTENLHQLQTDFSLSAHFSMLGRERALSHFTHEHIAQQTVKVYQDVLAQ
jgi:glycosyltransferase involved in cell wall biosynthesis